MSDTATTAPTTIWDEVPDLFGRVPPYIQYRHGRRQIGSLQAQSIVPEGSISLTVDQTGDTLRNRGYRVTVLVILSPSASPDVASQVAGRKLVLQRGDEVLHADEFRPECLAPQAWVAAVELPAAEFDSSVQLSLL